jgi:hypothetical protein
VNAMIESILLNQRTSNFTCDDTSQEASFDISSRIYSRRNSFTLAKPAVRHSVGNAQSRNNAIRLASSPAGGCCNSSQRALVCSASSGNGGIPNAARLPTVRFANGCILAIFF